MAGVLGSVLIDGRDDRPNHLSDWHYLQLRGVLDRLVAANHIDSLRSNAKVSLSQGHELISDESPAPPLPRQDYQ